MRKLLRSIFGVDKYTEMTIQLGLDSASEVLKERVINLVDQGYVKVLVEDRLCYLTNMAQEKQLAEQAKRVVEETWEGMVNSEDFIDSVVERIARKQLK